MPYPKKKIPTSRLVELYQAGDSLTAIAAAARHEYGISISWVAVRKRLIKAKAFTPNRTKIITPRSASAKKPQGHCRRPCRFAGCASPATGKHDYCKTHQRRVDRHGDPGVVLKRGRKPAN